MDDNKNFHVGIKALVFNEAGELLLVQEPDGMWELPGGRTEHGEQFEQTLKREIKEEMNLDCEVLDQHPYWAYSHQMSGSGRWKIILGFRATLPSLEFTPSDECIAVSFYSKEAMTKLANKIYCSDQLMSFTWPNE